VLAMVFIAGAAGGQRAGEGNEGEKP